MYRDWKTTTTRHASLDVFVCPCQAFQTCAEMDFEVLQEDPFLHQDPPSSSADSEPAPRVAVRSNATFLAELLLLLRQLLDAALAVVDTPGELFERDQVRGLQRSSPYGGRLEASFMALFRPLSDPPSPRPRSYFSP